MMLPTQIPSALQIATSIIHYKSSEFELVERGTKWKAYVIPPALGEVGENVLERVLEELEPNGEEPRDVNVAEHEHLEHPTK